MRTFLFLFMLGFMVLCGLMIADTGLFANCDNPDGCILLQKTTDDEIIQNTPPDPTDGGVQSFTLGSTDPNSEFKFQFYLNSKGAAIETATYSEFNDRDPEDPQPLQILSPASGNIMSFANKLFALVNQNKGFSLDILPWKTSGADVNDDGSRSASFEAIIETTTAEPVIKLTKTYTIRPGSYLIDCDIKIENLSKEQQKFYFDISGPVGISREGIRRDERKVVGGFRDPKEQVVGARLEITKFDGKKTYEEKPLTVDSGQFLWAAVADKYFTAILVPVPTGEKE
ncbi:MAG: YidC/Oxa1 family insertase periplasmic-domain containing protein, partial [Planctomycetota bacterium]